jgi:hypothetical protein
MKVVTYEGVVENGCVHVPAGVSLPEKAKVYVVIPEAFELDDPRRVRAPGPRLAHPEQARDFVKEVIEIQGEA